MLVVFGLCYANGGIEIVVIEGWIDTGGPSIFEVSRFDTANDTAPSVEESTPAGLSDSRRGGDWHLGLLMKLLGKSSAVRHSWAYAAAHVIQKGHQKITNMIENVLPVRVKMQVVQSTGPQLQRTNVLGPPSEINTRLM